MSQPDLFVVCKNCGSEVSPYVTECPYCGQRVRKRAPKLERSRGEDEAVRTKQRRRPGLSRLRAHEIEGIAPDTRPVATILLIAASLVITLLLATPLDETELGSIVLGAFDEPWRYVTAPFVHVSLGYQFVALTAVGVFGTLLERRFGPFAVLLAFLGAGAAGMAVAAAASLEGSLGEAAIQGANASALALLVAWLVDDRRAARRGDDRGNDLIGVAVFAVVLLLLPLAVLEASAVAGVTGALVGALLAPLLPLLARR